MDAQPIRVGQQWRMRGGGLVTVTFDRGDDQRWRWALSNSHIADENGCVGLNGKPDPCDLVELVKDAP